MKQIASFGCGVDSVAGLLLNSNYDEIIFADTLDELPSTYQYMEYFEKKSGLKITKVTSKHGSLYDYFFKGKSQSSKYHHWCSDKFKIQPIRKYLREKYGKKETFEMSIFIDFSEFHRMRESDRKYIKNKYPLVEQKLNRDQLKEIIKSKGYLLPEKSGCYHCCFTTKKGWIKLRNNEPELWEKTKDLENNSNTKESLIKIRGKDSQTLFECRCFNG
jgi:3'-phosphoadenosine 5'-phosphosulfate sulfotransferase (PAPS reductase)/FAD synthetase